MVATTVYSESIVFPSRVEVKSEVDNGAHSKARIIVSPLQGGFGVTLGNIMRRVLLSSIGGVAIDSMVVDGVLHEYSTIEGVLQSVPEIVYNLRRVVFKTEQTNDVNVSISVRGPKKVYASDLILPAGVSVLNGEHFLFEITGDNDVNIKLKVVAGVGDDFVDLEAKRQDVAVGAILFDKHFSPVLNVGVAVENTSFNGRSDYDRLILDVETNGSIKAVDAFRTAVSIIGNFISSIDDLNLKIARQASGSSNDAAVSQYNYDLLRSVNDLELSVRSLNCLQSENISYLGDLVKLSENDMLKTPNFGRKSLNELKAILSKYNLSFGMDNVEWPPKNMQELLVEAERYFNK